MFGPTRMTYDVARTRHQEHLDHASRVRMVREARRQDPPVTREARRLITAARLAMASTLHLFR